MSILAAYQKSNAPPVAPTNSQHHPQNIPLQWCPPCEGLIKVNVDAAEAGNISWGIGAIYRDHEGEVLASATWKISCNNEARIAEGMGMRLAMSLAVDLCFTKLEVESDCLEFITAVNNIQNHASYFHSLAQDCQKLKSSIQSCSFKFSKRNRNRVAHNLVKLACRIGDSIWIEEYPPAITQFVIGDCPHLALS